MMVKSKELGDKDNLDFQQKNGVQKTMQDVKGEDADCDDSDNPAGYGGCASCFNSLMIKLSIVNKHATPVNWKYVALSFLSLYTSAVSLTFLFPFLPEMIRSFGYTEQEKGKYGGYVAGSVFAGRAIGSVFWGWLADHHSRKLVLLVTIALNGTFAALFGFSTNIYVAMFFRFMCGAVNGTVGTAKAILYDISDNSNQAVGMCFLIVAWAFGMILGPFFGGTLASPAVKYPSLFADTVFDQFPYLLPSLFPFVSCVLIFVVILLKFDETYITELKRKKTDITIVEKTESATEDNNVHDHEGQLMAKAWTSQNSLHNLGRSLQSVSLDPVASMTLEVNHKILIDANVAAQASKYKTISQPDLTDTAVVHRQPMGARVNAGPHYSKSTPNVFVEVESEDCLLKELRHKDNRAGDHPQDPLLDKHNCSEINGGFINNRTKSNGVQKGEDDENEVQLYTETKTAPGNDAECRCMLWCCGLPACRPVASSSLARLMKLSDVWQTIMLYTIMSFVTIGVDDVFPVFASTLTELGGMGFTTDEIGLALGATTLPLLFMQIKIFPWLVERIGIKRVCLYGAVVCLITVQMLPMIRLLNNHKVWLWVCMLCIQVPFKVACNCCFAGSALLINNSAPRELAGQVNGLAMMATAIGRTFAPIVAGGTFTWVMTYGPSLGSPFDTSLPFFLLGCIYIITTIQCIYLNPSLDQQKK